MNSSNAQQIGEYLRTQRVAHGMSRRRLETLSHVSRQTILRLERGEIDKPSPAKLEALAAALDVPLADVWAVAGYRVDGDLPNPLPFLRAKYRDLPDSELNALTEDVAHILRQHGIDPHGRPNNNEDEAEGDTLTLP